MPTLSSDASPIRPQPLPCPESCGILADGRWTGSHGIGRFAREVLARLPVAARLDRGPRPLSPAGPLWLTCEVLARRPRVFFSPGFNPPLACFAPFVFTIHDLIHIDLPEVSTPTKRFYYRAIVKPACRKAYRVLTVSEHSRSRILAWSGLGAERVVNVGNGVCAPFHLEGPRYQPGFPYILYVGNCRPHKNLNRLFAAFLALARPDLKLVLAGTTARELAGRLEEHGISDRVHIEGSPSDDQLAAMYRGAALLVLPSLAEGFGLPALEAMACGTPVAASRIAALLETAENAAVFFDPLDTGDMTRAMSIALEDANLRARLIASGLQHAQSSSWDQVAARVLAVLVEAGSEPGH
jgi:glycosyltransferase involved in cell wall biosynthesis